jgi:hypothetical protein
MIFVIPKKYPKNGQIKKMFVIPIDKIDYVRYNLHTPGSSQAVPPCGGCYLFPDLIPGTVYITQEKCSYEDQYTHSQVISPIKHQMFFR